MKHLNYKIIGEGKTVVFLHGFLESLSMWDYLRLDQLAIKAVLIDLPGHGKSAGFIEEPSISNMAEQVLTLLKDLQLEPDALVGHSMGGYVALELAAYYSKPPKIVLLNSNFWADSEEKKHDRNRVIEVVKTSKSFFIKEVIPGLFENPLKHHKEVELLIEDALEMSSKSIADASAAMRDRKEFSKSDCVKNIHVIQGEFDRLIPLEKMLTLQKELGFELTIIRNAGHMAHIENTEECYKSIASSIQDL